MTHPKRLSLSASGVAALLTAGSLCALGASPALAAGTVSTVTGTAFGYGSFGVSALGGPPKSTGPTPTVALAANASNSPQSASAPTAVVVYGPATLFTADAIAISTSGSLGASGSVTSTASIKDVNKATTQSSLTGGEPLTADQIAGTCKSTPAGNTGSVTITNGSVVTDDSTTPITTVPVPPNPNPNTSIAGVVHVNTSVDHFHYVFNEQSTSGGALTVNVVHEYLDGPLTGGSLIDGQAVCGVNSSAPAGSPGTSSASGTNGTGTSGTGASTPGVGSASHVPPLVSVGLTVLGLGLITAAFLPPRRSRRRRSDSG